VAGVAIVAIVAIVSFLIYCLKTRKAHARFGPVTVRHDGDDSGDSGNAYELFPSVNHEGLSKGETLGGRLGNELDES